MTFAQSVIEREQANIQAQESIIRLAQEAIERSNQRIADYKRMQEDADELANVS